uniref:Uncharacterized protein n=1 Tax=Micrurus lemniscatus lemniscatus TaxID=129467 RepID=A0A2D4I9T2_MICLE
MYPDISSFIAPVPHCPELPIPTSRNRSAMFRSKSNSKEGIADTDYNSTDVAEEKKPYFSNQKDLSNLIRDLDLTKSQAELLTSKLKEWNLLDENVQVTDQRKHII